MARDTRQILFEFLADTKNLSRGTAQADKDLGKVEKGFSTAKKAVGGFVAAVGAREVFQFAQDTALMGEKAIIAGRSAEKVLGPALDGLRDRFGETRRAMGLNSGEFDEIVGKYGLLTEAAGLTDEAQANMIGGMIDAAADLAAFKGDLGLTTDAIDSLGGALRGEYDSLEQFGVKINQADVNALAEDLQENDAALSDSQAALEAFFSLLEDRGAAAWGSAAEGMDSLAGRTNEAEAAAEDLQIALGTALLPLMNDLTENAVDGADGLLRIVEAGDDLGEMIGGIGQIWDSLAGDLLVSIDEIKQEFRIWGRAISNVTRPFRDIRGWIDDIKRAIGGGFRNPFSSWKAPSLPSWIPRFHDGGVVPGPRGAEVPIIAQAGETIIPAGHTVGMGGGGGETTVINLSVSAGISSPDDVARAIVDALQSYNRNVGAVPIETRTANGIVT